MMCPCSVDLHVLIILHIWIRLKIQTSHLISFNSVDLLIDVEPWWVSLFKWPYIGICTMLRHPKIYSNPSIGIAYSSLRHIKILLRSNSAMAGVSYTVHLRVQNPGSCTLCEPLWKVDFGRGSLWTGCGHPAIIYPVVIRSNKRSIWVSIFPIKWGAVKGATNGVSQPAIIVMEFRMWFFSQFPWR